MVPLLMVVLRLLWLLTDDSEGSLAPVLWIWQPIQQPEAGLGELLVIEGEGLLPLRSLPCLRLRDLAGLLLGHLHPEVVLEALCQLLRHRQRLALPQPLHLEVRALKLYLAGHAHLPKERGQVLRQLGFLDRALHTVLVVEVGLLARVGCLALGATSPLEVALSPSGPSPLLGAPMRLSVLRRRCI